MLLTSSPSRSASILWWLNRIAFRILAIRDRFMRCWLLRGTFLCNQISFRLARGASLIGIGQINGSKISATNPKRSMPESLTAKKHIQSATRRVVSRHHRFPRQGLHPWHFRITGEWGFLLSQWLRYRVFKSPLLDRLLGYRPAMRQLCQWQIP